MEIKSGGWAPNYLVKMCIGGFKFDGLVRDYHNLRSKKYWWVLTWNLQRQTAKLPILKALCHAIRRNCFLMSSLVQKFN